MILAKGLGLESDSMSTWGRGGLGQGRVAMTTRTHFAFRIDLWDATGDNIVEHIAGAEDF
jgi:hypothetical protein